jgi:hypothetical protein
MPVLEINIEIIIERIFKYMVFASILTSRVSDGFSLAFFSNPVGPRAMLPIVLSVLPLTTHQVCLAEI